MWFTLMGLPGAVQTIDDNVDTLLTRLTATRAGYLDASISSRAAASSYTPALATKLDSNIDAKISSVGGGEVSGEYQSLEFTSNGNWTLPVGFNSYAFVTLVGAGGGGGDDTSNGGSGGGGGAFYWRWPVWVDQASTSTIAIGIGTGGAKTGTTGGAGGNSTFGSLLTAYGGGGGGENSPAGQGGQLTAAGTSATQTGAGGNQLPDPIDPQVFPAYGPLRTGFWSAGADGGEQDTVGNAGGDITLGGIPSQISGAFSSWNSGDLADFFYAIGAGKFVDTTGGTPSGNAGGGGASYGNGGNVAGTAPGYGGGGAGELSADGQAGGNGYCKIEWFGPAT